MAELIVMVCLLGSPEKCQEFRVPEGKNEEVVRCIREGGVNADKWQLANDKYFIIGWRCAKGEKASKVPTVQ